MIQPEASRRHAAPVWAAVACIVTGSAFDLGALLLSALIVVGSDLRQVWRLTK